MINIENLQKNIYISDDFINSIEEIVKLVLNEEKVNKDFDINIMIVDNEYIKEINSKHRGIYSATDCLSFPLLSYKEGHVFKEQYADYEFKEFELDEGKITLGDILISAEKAKSQSLEFGHEFNREIIYLTIHSILHLLGYDHMECEEKEKMRAREKEIIRLVGIFK